MDFLNPKFWISLLVREIVDKKFKGKKRKTAFKAAKHTGLPIAFGVIANNVASHFFGYTMSPEEVLAAGATGHGLFEGFKNFVKHRSVH